MSHARPALRCAALAAAVWLAPTLRSASAEEETGPKPAVPGTPAPADVRLRLVPGEVHRLASSVSFDANLSASSARGGGSGRATAKAELAARLVVETEDSARRPLRVRVALDRLRIEKSDMLREQEDADRARVQKARKLDPDDHPLAGHTLVYDRAAKPPALLDFGTEKVKSAGTRVEKRYGDVVAILEETLVPAWSETAPLAVIAGQSWTFDAVRFLRFAGVELPERIHDEKDRARGECTATAQFAAGKAATIPYQGTIRGRWETNPWTCTLEGAIAIDGEAGCYDIAVSKCALGIDESKSSGVRGDGSLEASMKLSRDPKATVPPAGAEPSPGVPPKALR